MIGHRAARARRHAVGCRVDRGLGSTPLVFKPPLAERESIDKRMVAARFALASEIALLGLEALLRVCEVSDIERFGCCSK